MATEKYNEMVFCKDNYENELEMWDDIRDFLRILTKQDMQIEFYCDEQGLGIYCANYNTRKDYGTAHIEWLAEDEFIDSYKSEEEDNNEN